MQINEIKLYLKKQKITYEELSLKSNIPIGTLKSIFSGRTPNPRIDTVKAIERALGINANKPIILDEVEINDLYPIPLLGEVVAGVPLEAQENTEGYVYISYRPKEEYFALRVHGDSMKNAGIQDKSILICHKQETAENGDIIVAMINKEQTVKRFKQIGQSIFLMPENHDYDPIPVTTTDELIILGKVVEVRFSI